jgi:hypothetical protein
MAKAWKATKPKRDEKAFVHKSEKKKVLGSRSKQNVQLRSQESVAVNLMAKLGCQTKRWVYQLQVRMMKTMP